MAATKKDKNEGELFINKIGDKERQKLKSLRENKPSIWSGIGMFGMVGWSITVPAISGVLLGMWLDKKYPQSFSWTLTFLILGLLSGCVIAWYWVSKEGEEMNKNEDDNIE